jgi:hypothetical protein
VRQVTLEQANLNDGLVPDELRAVLADPVFAKYGQFSDVLARIDMEDMVREGEPNDLYAATNGRYRVVEWEQVDTLSPELVADNRPDDQTNTMADEIFHETLGTLTPNVSSAMTSLFTTVGGGVHRTPDNIAEADIPEAEHWRSEAGSGRTKSSGADMRGPAQTGGAYLAGSNVMVVSDRSVLANDYSPVVTHELGHALDSMLGGVLGSDWFSHSDAGFQKLHEDIKDTASYGDDPNDSVLFWYFRNDNEGSVDHNGQSGTTEIFAQGLSAYSSAVAEMNGPEAQGTTHDAIYWKIGNELTHGTGIRAMRVGGLSAKEVRAKTTAMGKAVFDYYDDLEKNRLPKLMSAPRVVPTRERPMEFSITHGDAPITAPAVQKRATPSQLAKLDKVDNAHHGLIQLQTVERGTPEWQAMETAIKEHSPGTQLPSAQALKVTWNPLFPEQGNTVIYKALMPSNLDKATTAYTDEHKKTQAATKHSRVERVNVALAQIYDRVRAEAPYNVTAAASLALLNLGMRVGSGESTDPKTKKKIETFGATSMLKKHVFYPVGQDRAEEWLRFKFPGKAGVTNTYNSKDPVLNRAVLALLEGKGPSEPVFGGKGGTNPRQTIQYFRDASGLPDMKNHDTRTLYATEMARKLVAKQPKSKMPKDKAARDREVNRISKEVGIHINDEMSTTRDNYISPAVWEPFDNSAGIPPEFDTSPPADPNGLIEGDIVQSIGGPAVGGPPAPAGGGEAPPLAAALDPRFLTEVADVFAGTAIDDQAVPEEPELSPEDAAVESAEADQWQMDWSPAGQRERGDWFASFTWSDPPLVAKADPAFDVEDGDADEQPEQPAPAPAEET